MKLSNINNRLSFARERGGEFGGKLALFLFSPIVGFVYSIKRINTKSSFWIFILFAAIFGFALYIPAEKGLEALSVDSTYHRQFFEQVSRYETFGEFKERFLRYITFGIDTERGEIIKDYYLDTVFYISSLFSNTHRLGFMIFAVVFTFFMLKSLRFFVCDKDFKLSYYTLCLLIIFTFNQIINIHWLRFPTAAWIAVYMIFQVYVNNNKKYWLLLPLTVVVHGGFFSFAIIMLIVELTKRYDKFWIALFFVSFFISSIPQDFVDSISGILPERFASYLHYGTAESVAGRAELIETRRTGTFIQLFAVLMNVFMNILMLYIINFHKKNNEKERIYSVLLVIFTIVNMFSFVKEFSERFRLITFPLLAYVWFKTFPVANSKSSIVKAVPFVFAYQLALYGYMYYMTCSYPIFVTPFFTVGKYLLTGDF